MKFRIFINVCLIIILTAGIMSAQKAKIETEALSPNKLAVLGLTTNTSSGLDVVGNETYVYISANNIGNSEPINSAVFEFVSKPAGSQTILEDVNNPLWKQFKPDAKGTYVIKLTINTAGGSHDTTKTIYVADFVGVGNFEGIPANYPNCMTCHQNHDKFVQIFERWKVSGHATRFKRTLTTGTNPISSSSLRSFTTGYYPDAENNCFDDVAEKLGWELGSANPSKWDSMKTYYSNLVNFATIGCENCHGPGGEHTMGTNPDKINISLNAGVCSQCHDNPPRNNQMEQWEESLHADAIWSSSFAQGANSQKNDLQNCIRCHDGRGFVNFTKGITTNTTGMIQANHTKLTCATCHDPHGNSNEDIVRFPPVEADTLASGVEYAGYGKGMLCMSCHKARRDNVTYSQTKVTSAHWGPHHSVQTDVFLGQNAAEFGSSYKTSPHKFAVEDACVGCHMVATTDTGTVNRNKVGGHTFSLYNEETGYYHTDRCESCHGSKTSWDDFVAKRDYDGDGNAESISGEIDGLLLELRKALPPFGIDSISYTMIGDTNDINLNKAYFNYQLIAYDGSKGMHNSIFAIDVLQQSIKAIGGIVLSAKDTDGSVPVEFSLNQNYPNPFNPSTTIRYSLPFESNIKISIFSLTGELVGDLEKGLRQSGTYEVKLNMNSFGTLASGIYFYTIEVKPLNGKPLFKETKKMVLMK